MSTVTVYNNDKEVFRADIFHEFHIKEDLTGELYWYEVRAANTKKEGTRQIWIQAIGFDPMLAFLFPTWQLVINDVWMEKKFYMEEVKNLKGKEVELRYKEYRFVFQFD